jgi:GH25 family lysozyme M1 (1,4-beta-N-acetylmuramidase)
MRHLSQEFQRLHPGRPAAMSRRSTRNPWTMSQWLYRLLIPLAWLLVSTSARALTVCPAGSVVEGVDVSYYDGIVDWNRVKASGRAFAFANVGFGLSADSSFARNYAGIKAAGMIRGATQFFRPGQDPTAQANLLLASIGVLSAGDLPPVLDIEVTDGQSPATIVSRMQTWMSIVQQATGVTPMVYTSRGFWNTGVGSPTFTASPLFVAAWGVSCPNTPYGWSDWQFWQFSDSDSVPGIGFAVDLDRFNGSIGDLYALAGLFQIVRIDIKPGDDVPSINPNSHGKIPVAILSDASFNAPMDTDTATLTFGRTGNEHSLAFCSVEDVNGDGLPDLICHFSTQATAFQSGDTVGVLKGRTLAGIPLRGTDAIVVVD